MKEFGTSLLREKFTIHDPKNTQEGNEKTVVALSNRMVVELKNDMGTIQERLVIRAQNMHSCVRMTAKIIQSFTQSGPIHSRPIPYDWEGAWSSIVNNYEQDYNPQHWIAIYAEGKVIFKGGAPHPLLELIERCDHDHKGEYEDAIPLAEAAFKATGKIVNIKYDGNVALIVNFNKSEARCAIILRGPDRTTTFNFTAASKGKEALNFPQCLKSAAAFLEGMQLAFMTGMNSMKIQMGLIEQKSEEGKQTREARKRLARLGGEISSLEDAHEVHYRPERPDFQKTVMEAEKLGAKILSPAEGSGFIA